MSQLSRANARAIFDAAVAAVQPDAAFRSCDLREFQRHVSNAARIIVVGGGKAGAGMVHALESMLAGQLDRVTGLVNVPDFLTEPTQRIILNPARPAKFNEPTMAASLGAEQMLTLARTANGNDIVTVLLSGGGSALLPLPVPELELNDKIEISRSLSRAGATIHELNCVRKHISQIKGGRLAEAARKAGAVWTLVISDVVGDPLEVIASGPTAQDPSTFADALNVMTKYQLERKFPSIWNYLARGNKGEVAETVKSIPPNVHNRIIANNSLALEAAKQMAITLGYTVEAWPTPIVGEATNAAKAISQVIPKLKGRTCLLFGGETTVTTGLTTGLGGRNQELALALASELAARDLHGITLLCCGTDGEDGPTDAAGACVDAEVWCRRIVLPFGPEHYLKIHDSYHFFQPIGGLIRTGLTGTNVMDIGLVLVD